MFGSGSFNIHLSFGLPRLGFGVCLQMAFVPLHALKLDLPVTYTREALVTLGNLIFLGCLAFPLVGSGGASGYSKPYQTLLSI